MNAAMEPIDPQTARSRAETFLVLDTREPEAFARGHLAGSGHIPRGDFVARRSELPPRDAAILVVAEDARAAAMAAAALEALGYSAVSWLDASLDALAGGLADRAPAARLWRPAPFLEEVLPLISRPPGSVPRGEAFSGDRPRALDLACGAGRDAVFLGLHGFEV
jgi:tellurite methyltransferase